jgi:glycosyltransferase involved in cell wall biosynthesis
MFVSFQVFLVKNLLGFRAPFVIGSEFTCWYSMPAIRRHPFFFHFADKISAFREVASIPEKRRFLEDMEFEIIREANVSGCSSRLIHQHVLDAASNRGLPTDGILYLPHAVDARVFDESQNQTDPADIADLPRPIAGYYGTLTQANDKETFLAAAKALPDWSFVFIGKVVGDYDELAALGNVHFLGPKAHADIPRYGRCFDVCFMGWLPHEWITNCFPLKTMEYLFLGKPIVCSCRIDEVAKNFPGLIRFTNNSEEFVRGLVEEFAHDSSARVEERRDAVGDFTWEAYVDKVLGAFGNIRDNRHDR